VYTTVPRLDNLWCRGTTDTSVVEGKKPRTVNCEKWRPSDSSSLTAAGGAILQWKTSLATRGTAMMIRKQNCNTQPGRRKEQRSSDSTEENGNHTEETQNGSTQSPTNIGVGQENGKTLNKRNRWSREEMKEVLWCFMYIKEKTLREN